MDARDGECEQLGQSGCHRVRTPCPRSESVPILACPGPRVETGHRGGRADFRASEVDRGSHFSFSLSSSHLLRFRGKGRRIQPAPSNGPIVTSWPFRPAGPAAVRRAAARGTARQELPRRDLSRRTTTIQKVCDGRRLSSALARYHSGISCWPASIGRSPALRPPPSVLRVTCEGGTELYPTPGKWVMGSDLAVALPPLFLPSSRFPRISANAPIPPRPPPQSSPTGSRNNSHANRRTTTPQDTHTHTHTHHTDETQTCTTGVESACVRARRVWSGVAVVLPSDKKRIFLDLGMLVTEASPRFVHSVPPFPSLSASFRCAFVARVTSCQRQSGETELDKIKRPRRGKVTGGGGSQRSAPDERTNGVNKAPKKEKEKNTSRPLPCFPRRATAPPSIYCIQASWHPTDPNARSTAHSTTTAARRLRPRPSVCPVSPPHTQYCGIHSHQEAAAAAAREAACVCVPDAAPI